MRYFVDLQANGHHTMSCSIKPTWHDTHLRFSSRKPRFNFTFGSTSEGNGKPTMTTARPFLSEKSRPSEILPRVTAMSTHPRPLLISWRYVSWPKAGNNRGLVWPQWTSFGKVRKLSKNNFRDFQASGSHGRTHHVWHPSDCFWTKRRGYESVFTSQQRKNTKSKNSLQQQRWRYIRVDFHGCPVISNLSVNILGAKHRHSTYAMSIRDII